MDAGEVESKASEREERFTDLYERSYGRIYAYASRRVGRERADEVAAETFLIAWRRFELLPNEPLPWLYGVAGNVIMRLLAASKREDRSVAGIRNELVVVSETGADGVGDERLWSAWARLSDRDREVLALIAWEELSVAEAAAVLGCSAPVFSVRLHRARRRLAALLAAAEPSSPSPLSEVRS